MLYAESLDQPEPSVVLSGTRRPTMRAWPNDGAVPRPLARDGCRIGGPVLAPASDRAATVAGLPVRS
jgi:hypothetical protein